MEDTARPKTAPQLHIRPLAEYPQSEIASIASLLPDTPWTTTAIQACERRLARAWIDDPETPRSVAVVLPAEPGSERPPVAHIFGSDAPPVALVAWALQQPRPLDVVCDEGVGRQLFEDGAEAQFVDATARWFEHLDGVERPESAALRRLRLRDAEDVEALGAPGLLGAFETLKDLLMVGGASGVIEDGRIVSAAFTVDQSVNYARIHAYTLPDRRGEGLALAACRHLIAAHHEQGRLACALVPSDDESAQALAKAIGFEGAARVRRYRLS